LKTKIYLYKTISWRLVGTLDTLLLSWLITGNFDAGVQIGMADAVVKMLLYYAHERVWHGHYAERPNRRHVLKSVSWRMVGTLSTILLAYLIWGEGLASLQIGGAETLTKMILYYFHEKLWFRFYRR
jgi:uncharacterized membrane protein